MTARLDRIEAAIEANATQIKANAVQIEANWAQIKANSAQIELNSVQIKANAAQIQTNSVAIAELHTTVNSLVQIVEIHQRNFEVIMNEIRGIRTENQRILEHLFGKEEN